MNSLRPKNIYAEPKNPPLADCEFYHTMELPGEPSHPGDWDLTNQFTPYTAGVDFTGKSFLDVGAATGFCSFAAESAGACRVVSLDIPTGHPIDLIPWAENNPDALQKSTHLRLDRIKNSYWYCHRALGSKAKVTYRSVYALNDTLGKFDIVMAGCLLLHLRDPFGALARIADRTSSTLIIVEMDPGGDCPVFLPNLSSGYRDPKDIYSWWKFPISTMARFLDVLGFAIDRIESFTLHSPTTNLDGKFYAIAAHRRP